MSHLPHLIADLGLILSVAAVTTLVFKRIKQPLVLGYIVAGLMVGPYVAFLPTVLDEDNLRTWSEIGVIFLLFSLGLEFSFKKVAKVGGTASVTAITTVCFMLVAGFGIGQAMGWTVMDSLFLGGILSISSTTIIVRALDELGLKTRGFANLVVGVLVIEDLVAILLMVVLSTLAVSRQFSGAELLFAMGKLVAFLAMTFIIGIYLIPTALHRTRKLMNEETLLVVSVALCLTMVFLAARAGFSAALGAFLMGSLLAETVMAERIEHLVKPVKDLFGAIFFVSVGMMIEPRMLVEHWQPVLIISLVVMLGQPISSAAGALLSGQPLKRAVQTGMSLSQIGEFSFIIATLGVSLGVTSSFLYPVAVAVSAITTFATPYMIRASDGMADVLTRGLPATWVAAIERYSQQTSQVKVTSDWRVLLRSYALNVVLFFVLSVAVIMLSSRHLTPMLDRFMDGRYGHVSAGLITLVLILPLIWAMSIRRIKRAAYRHLWLNKKQLRGPLVAIEVARLVVAVLVLGLLVNQFFSTGWAFGATVVFMGLAIVLFRRRLHRFYQRVEQRFMHNLNQREQQRRRPHLAPWDMHLAEVEVKPGTLVVGRSLEEIKLREKHGVNVALIERDDRNIPAPHRDERLLPGDRLVVIGTDEQLSDMNRTLEAPIPDNGDYDLDKDDIALEKYRVLPRSPLIGTTIRASRLREEAMALVAGIERGDQRIMNPESFTTFEQSDLVWLVGNTGRIHAFMERWKAVRE
ncbi:MAG TPA: cation:proton antiporter [Flavobacteriales bacterium]|nr:cation:proton antiporter [Flavobacteriales bacterium]